MPAIRAFRALPVMAATMLACALALPAQAQPQQQQQRQQQQNLPEGSWRDTCRDARIDGRSTLRAQCRNTAGQWVRSSLDLDRCGPRRPVANDNGQLVCERPSRPWWGRGLPPGSYQQTCRNARIEGRDLLIAECRRKNNNYRNTRLDIDECRGRDIANDNGHLVCGNKSFAGNYGLQLPAGSWTQSCRNARIIRDDLFAECRRNDGNWNRTRLDLDECGRLPVANRNGELVCDRPWWGQGLPRGSYQQTCRNARIEGRDLLIAQCTRRNGNLRNTRLDIDECRGRDIANDNGHLVCGDRRFGGNYGGIEMPKGSWTESCRNPRIIRDDLIAECRANDGRWNRTSLDLDECRDRLVANSNGRLVCTRTSAAFHGMPGGSWQQSCRNPRFDSDGRLIAECRRNNGSWSTDRIRLSDCRNLPIRNQDGALRCP